MSAFVCSSFVFVMQGSCVKLALPGLVEAHYRSVPSSESYLTSIEEIFHAAQVFLLEMNWIQVLRTEDIWSVQIELPPVQFFFPHFLQFCSLYHYYFLLFQMCKHIRLHSGFAV